MSDLLFFCFRAFLMVFVTFVFLVRMMSLVMMMFRLIRLWRTWQQYFHGSIYPAFGINLDNLDIYFITDLHDIFDIVGPSPS